ncbi:MAG: serine/threonine protein kinase [Deltaproteobacteria bacterium]|nr:serine/threonine protein kinase [Deltaproteobacteria bacterium]
MTAGSNEDTAAGPPLERTRVLGGDDSHDLAGTTDGGEHSSSDAPLQRGRLVGRYIVLERLGAGGMGVVYRAFDPDLDRSVALKLVTVDRERGDDERSRLLREAQAMARLAHPNVIPVFDVGIEGQLVFVAMELVDGMTLAQWCRADPRSWREILACFAEAGQGLAAAHAVGLIHRDFKPDNVMVGAQPQPGRSFGRVRVLDFGLARHDGSTANVVIDREASAELLRSSGARKVAIPLEHSMTADGAVMGTPAYMSPEQHLGAEVQASSDQFSFCVALWQALYGAPPFAGDSLVALATNVLQGRLREPPAGTKVPRHVHAALVRGLETDERRRHPSMLALLEALDRDRTLRRRRVAALALGGTALLTAGVIAGSRIGGRIPVESRPAPCTGSEAAIAQTWNDPRRDAIARAFRSTGLTYAPAAAQTVTAAIDDYTAAWIDARTAACTATRVTGEQSEAVMDVRMRCLERRRTELDALLAGLVAADDAAVEHSIDAVHGLARLEQCNAPDEAAPAAPDREAVAITERAEQALAYVASAEALGHFAEARLRLSPWVVTATLVDHPPLTVQIAGWEGALTARLGLPDDAIASYRRAFAAALAADDPRRASELATNLTHEVGFVKADRGGGETWLALGRALVRRSGGDPERAAQLDSAEGSVLVAAGSFEAALVAHGRALTYWSAHAPDGLEVARVLDDIGAALVRLGRYDEAIVNHRRAIAIRTAHYGEQHPIVADSLRELGSALSLAGKLDLAVEPLTQALAATRTSRGPRSIAVATLLDDLGRIARRSGDLELALQRHREALSIWEERLGDPHPDLAISLLNVGYTLVAAGRPSEAVPIDERALAMFEATVGGQHPMIVYAGNALGMSRLAAGDAEGARMALEQALALQGKVEVDPTLFGDTLFALAKARWRLATDARARADARALGEQARALYGTDAAQWQREIDEIDAWLAAPR